jgi:hypothetical protein
MTPFKIDIDGGSHLNRIWIQMNIRQSRWLRKPDFHDR